MPPGPRRYPIVGNLFNMCSELQWETYLEWSMKNQTTDNRQDMQTHRHTDLRHFQFDDSTIRRFQMIPDVSGRAGRGRGRRFGGRGGEAPHSHFALRIFPVIGRFSTFHKSTFQHFNKFTSFRASGHRGIRALAYYGGYLITEGRVFPNVGVLWSLTGYSASEYVSGRHAWLSAERLGTETATARNGNDKGGPGG